MRALKRLKHTWPKRGPAERRLHPRLTTRFPVVIDPGQRTGSVSCWTINMSVGGLWVASPQLFEVFTLVNVAFQVPVTERGGDVSEHLFEVPATVLRTEPDELDDSVETYETALKFNRKDDLRDGILANHMLQMHLYDPDSTIV